MTDVLPRFPRMMRVLGALAGAGFAVTLSSCGAQTRRCADLADPFNKGYRYTAITATGTTCKTASLLATFFVSTGSVTSLDPDDDEVWKADHVSSQGSTVQVVHAKSGRDRVTFTVRPPGR